MLKKLYSIAGRDENNIDSRVKYLLDNGGDVNKISYFLANHGQDPMRVKEAVCFYYTGEYRVPLTGSGFKRNLNNSIYAKYIPEIKRFLIENNGNHKLAEDYFRLKYGINRAFIFLVANTLGIDTAGKNIHTRNTFKDFTPDIVEMFKNGASIGEVYEKYKHINISRRYLNKLHRNYAPRENIRVRRDYGTLKEEIIKQLKAGVSAEDLSNKYGVRKKMIEDWRRIYVGYIYNVQK